MTANASYFQTEINNYTGSLWLFSDFSTRTQCGTAFRNINISRKFNSQLLFDLSADYITQNNERCEGTFWFMELIAITIILNHKRNGDKKNEKWITLPEHDFQETSFFLISFSIFITQAANLFVVVSSILSKKIVKKSVFADNKYYRSFLVWCERSKYTLKSPTKRRHVFHVRSFFIRTCCVSFYFVQLQYNTIFSFRYTLLLPGPIRRFITSNLKLKIEVQFEQSSSTAPSEADRPQRRMTWTNLSYYCYDFVR